MTSVGVTGARELLRVARYGGCGWQGRVPTRLQFRTSPRYLKTLANLVSLNLLNYLLLSSHPSSRWQC